MTTPGEMVRCAAAALGLPEMTLTQIDRELVVNGLRAKGGRGRSAARMASGDVTNLLIGAASGVLVKDVVEAVRTYSALPANPPSIWDLEGFPLPSVSALPEDHTFGEVLRAFIEAFALGEFEAAHNALPKERVGEHTIPNLTYLEFRLLGPYPQAAIRIFGPGFGKEVFYNRNPRGGEDTIAWSKGHEAKGYGDLMRVQLFTARAIHKMADFLRGGTD